MATSPSAGSQTLLRRFALAALLTNIGIVVTGGLVRVTGSGLGCPTWPTCDGETVVPRPGSGHATWQTAVEFGNRLLTFVVLAAVVGAFVQVRRTRPHTRAVERLALALPLGVVLQAVVGGITVRMQLSPLTVAVHFLLSMVLIALAAMLYERVRGEDRGGGLAVPAGVRHATTALLAVAAAVLVLGTVVTGAGPHAGDPGTPRLGVDIRFAAIAHADAVWLLVGLTVALVAVTWRPGPPSLRATLRWLLALEVAQGVIGYTQYALGIPEALVAIHILGSTLVWTLAVLAWVRARPPHPHHGPDAPADAPAVRAA
ncbi:MAG TPA: COX15/CtaA family protein [Egicoccus sp.]|nr:COX15/CtaA family protein [Egicoccus sp.]HSK23917.1 COX15/CtaA family protein [Egicoccus sp.]